jgi:hypothetical protein
MMGNPLMNDALLSQTAGRAKTRQPGLIVEPTQIVLSSYPDGNEITSGMGQNWIPNNIPINYYCNLIESLVRSRRFCSLA